MGRIRTFNRDATLEKAMNFFQTHGYDASPLSGLLTTMEISRGSFYQCFESKEALFKECLEFYQKQHFRSLDTMYEESASSIDFIKEFFSSLATRESQGKWEAGCFIVNCVAESPQLPEICRLQAQEGLNTAKALFKRVAERARKENLLREEVNTDQFATYLYNTAIGLRVQLRSGATIQELEDTVSFVLNTLPTKS